jgi:hypothetical protein
MCLSGLIGERLEKIGADGRLVGRVADFRPFLDALFELSSCTGSEVPSEDQL